MLGLRGGLIVLLCPVRGCQYASSLEKVEHGATDTHIGGMIKSCNPNFCRDWVAVIPRGLVLTECH